MLTAGQFGAVDLGTSAAMSAVASYWPGGGRLESLAAFPAEPSPYRNADSAMVLDGFTSSASIAAS